MTFLFKTIILLTNKTAHYEIYADGSRHYAKCIHFYSCFAWEKGQSFYLEDVKKSVFKSDRELIKEEVEEKLKTISYATIK